MSKTYAEVVNLLDAKIPASAISEREAGNGRTLAYLEGWSVIARLNEVLGQGNWDYTTDQLSLVSEGKTQDNYGKDTFTCHYIAKVSLRWYVTNEQGQRYIAAQFSDFGYGDGSDKRLQGKAHELAVKEAVTDAVKRCAKNLGMSMGLGLYDKSRAFVDETPTASAPAPAAPAPIKAEAKKPGPKPKAAVAAKAAEAPTPKPAAPKIDEKPLDEAIKLIRGTVRTIVNMKKRTGDEIKTEFTKKYGIESADKLTQPQANEWLGVLNQVLHA